MISDNESVTNYLGRFTAQQTKFKFIGGQIRIIDAIVEYCQQLYNNQEQETAHDDADSTFITLVVDEASVTTTGSPKLFNEIGAYMINVYNDAKRVTLSGWSWPSRHVADEMASSFKARGYSNIESSLHYVTPTNHAEFLNSIVKSDLQNARKRLLDSLAISLRLDGSVDITQEHNVYVMAQVVNKNATVSTLFLGFGVPESGCGSDYLKCLKNITKDILPWEELFPLVSSAVTDGESLNSGNLTGLCTRLAQERCKSASPRLPFFWIWCIAHRINLAWKSVCKLNIIVSLVHLCRDLSTHFHKSGARTLKLKQISTENNLATPLHYPPYFPTRWTEYLFNLFTVVLRNWRASMNYFQSEKLEILSKQWLSFNRLYFLTFLTDILGLVKKFQKACQSDTISILELFPMKHELYESLERCKGACLEGGWEELFLQKVDRRDGEIHFYGFVLTESTVPRYRTRNRRAPESVFSISQRKYIIESLVKHLKERIDLDATLYEKLKPLAKIIPSSSEQELKRCASFIIPDMDERQFISDYYVAAESFKNKQFNTVLDSLKLLNEYHPDSDQLMTLKTALARIAAAKPHSADVERLISVYNKFKDSDRASLSPKTLYNYLYVNINMGPLESFDPTAAVQFWMSQKERR